MKRILLITLMMVLAYGASAQTFTAEKLKADTMESINGVNPVKMTSGINVTCSEAAQAYLMMIAADGTVSRYDTTGLWSGGGGAATFLDLTDTPSSYAGLDGWFLKVNRDEDGLEFQALSMPTSWWTPVGATSIRENPSNRKVSIGLTQDATHEFQVWGGSDFDSVFINNELYTNEIYASDNIYATGNVNYSFTDNHLDGFYIQKAANRIFHYANDLITPIVTLDGDNQSLGVLTLSPTADFNVAGHAMIDDSIGAGADERKGAYFVMSDGSGDYFTLGDTTGAWAPGGGGGIDSADVVSYTGWHINDTGDTIFSAAGADVEVDGNVNAISYYVRNSELITANASQPGKITFGGGSIVEEYQFYIGSSGDVNNQVFSANSSATYVNNTINTKMLLAPTYMQFYANNATTPRMKIDTNGNVGIGTTSPTEALHVVGNGLFTGNFDADTAKVNDVYIENDLYVDGQLAIRKTSVQLFGEQVGSPTSIFGKFLDTYMKADASANRIDLTTGGTTSRLVLTGTYANFPSTNVGIGTSTPTEMLDVNGNIRASYASGVYLLSFRGETDTDITGWIMTNENGDTCYCYPNAAGNGMVVTTTKP